MSQIDLNNKLMELDQDFRRGALPREASSILGLEVGSTVVSSGGEGGVQDVLVGHGLLDRLFRGACSFATLLHTRSTLQGITSLLSYRSFERARVRP